MWFFCTFKEINQLKTKFQKWASETVGSMTLRKNSIFLEINSLDLVNETMTLFYDEAQRFSELKNGPCLTSETRRALLEAMFKNYLA